MYGLNHVRRAAALVDGPDGYSPTREELCEAFAHVWGAVAFSDHWPADLRADLAGLIVFCRRYGSCADTAHRMTPAEIQEFTAELRRFVGRAARVPDEVPVLAGMEAREQSV
jgi:hypothetical protein